MKRALKVGCLILILIFLIVTMVACQKINRDEGNSYSVNSITLPNFDKHQWEDLGNDVLAEMTESPATITKVDNVSPLGKVAFIREEAISNKLIYDPLLSDQTLSLKDSNGFTWTLKIPSSALLNKQEITMTALANIDSNLLGKFTSGVALEPDGLTFLQPVELTVVGSNVSKDDFILSSAGDGTNLDLIAMKENKYPKALLNHFSNKYTSGRTSFLDDLLLKAAKIQIQISLNQAQELLKQPLRVPVPPSISLPEKCKEDKQKSEEISDKVSKYVEDFREPEYKIIRELTAAYGVYSRIQGESYDPEFTVQKKLLKRLLKKCDKLIANYKPKAEYFTPVAKTVFSVAYEWELIGTEPNDETTSYYFEIFGEWGQEIIKEYLDDIRNKHLYSKAYPILWLGKNISIIDSSLPATFGSDLFYKLGRVLTFKVEFKNTLSGSDLEFMVEGNAKKISIDITMQEFGGLYKGEGTGEYTKVIGPEENVTVEMPNSFPVKAFINNFEPCHSDKFNVYINAFGPKNDVWVAAGYKQSVSGIVNSTTGLLFEDRRIKDAELLSLLNTSMLYDFEMLLQDGQEVAGQISDNRSLEDLDLQYTLKLVHTPLKAVEN